MKNDSIPCLGGPCNGRNAPNAGNSMDVVSGGKKHPYFRDSMNLCGTPFHFWRFHALTHENACAIILEEAKGTVRDLMRETFEMAEDLSRA